MSVRIQGADLAATVKSYLDEFGDKAEACMRVAVEKTAADAVKELRAGGFGFKGQKYNKSWNKQIDNKRFYTAARVYNKEHYRLTHLLEFGHAKRGGGRTTAFPHISKVNDEVEEHFVDHFTELLADELTK